MPSPLEDYALIGDLQTAGLVGRDGSLDWLCLPDFGASACFAALLGDARNGCWRIAPAGEVGEVRRRYRPGTLVLETEFVCPGGTVRVVDAMPPRESTPDVARIVEGVSGRVAMRMELVVRFDYGSIVPWVRRRGTQVHAVAGPDALWLQSDMPTRGEDLRTLADFEISAGEDAAFLLTWTPSWAPAPPVRDPRRLVADTTGWWTQWSGRCTYRGRWREDVLRSLITLKALTYAPTGGIVAAPTTSLPEQLGGPRNWDYRYCWVRDATLTLAALIDGGYVEEAGAWRDWLLRAVAAQPSAMQIMYSVTGGRRLPELELDWLAGYEGSRPVRIGNAASHQFQLDVYGELFDALHRARCAGLHPDADAWEMQRVLLDFLQDAWPRPDEGIWEVRSGRRHFVHSKVMAWVAFDRAVRTVERFGVAGPADRWRAQRAALHAEILERGYDAGRGSFVQSYGSQALDAALLMLPLVGFLPADDPRMVGTVEAIRRELSEDGFVLRYRTDATDDGLSGGEGTFLPCSFWLAQCLALMGDEPAAEELFERLRGLANDVGLLSEEYDVSARRLVGNFPQAFTHVGLLNTAVHLDAPANGSRRAP